MQQKNGQERIRRRTPRGLLHTFLHNLLLTLLLTGAAAMAVGAAAPAGALPIEASVGAGPDLATVVLRFEDGADFAFEVAFDDAIATNGIEIMQALESELAGFSLTILDFGFGLFIDGIAYDGHSDAGFGGAELYWHYWTKDAETDPWLSSPIGAVDRIVPDGAYEGWVYGTAAAPIPEPGSGLLVGLGLCWVARVGRRAQSPESSSGR